MLRLPRLHQGAPGAPEASGTARNLLQYLERALGGARIAVRQPDVGIDYADQRQQREIMALGDKLRADDDVASAFGDGVELLAQPLRAAWEIRREDERARLRPKLRDFVGEPLHPRSAGNERI